MTMTSKLSCLILLAIATFAIALDLVVPVDKDIGQSDSIETLLMNSGRILKRRKEKHKKKPGVDEQGNTDADDASESEREGHIHILNNNSHKKESEKRKRNRKKYKKERRKKKRNKADKDARLSYTYNTVQPSSSPSPSRGKRFDRPFSKSGKFTSFSFQSSKSGKPNVRPKQNKKKNKVSLTEDACILMMTTA